MKVRYINPFSLSSLLSYVSVVDGGWGRWGSYTTCSKACGPGIKTRSRRCNNPAPQNGGKQCAGKYQQAERCKIKDCLKGQDMFDHKLIRELKRNVGTMLWDILMSILGVLSPLC